MPKKTLEERSIFAKLVAESHFLVLPSRADCVPVVIAEANSFGIPVVTSDVGGIPSVVRNGVNGSTFPLENFVEQACNFILQSMGNFTIYSQLAISSFEQYKDRLNWQVAGKKVKELLDEICG